MTMTLNQAIQHTGTDVLDYLDREVTIPTVTKAACQGDVSIFRDDKAKAATTPMPKAVTVVRSEASSNTHVLHPDGDCYFDYNDRASVRNLTLGTLTVPAGSKALLMHQEHGGMSIEPGTYRIGRQREFAGEWAYVAD